MTLLVSTVMMLMLIAVLGVIAWHLDQREREERLARETLETSRLLDESLEERLSEIDQYRHDLAALLQQLDLDEVRLAEERAASGRRSAAATSGTCASSEV